MMTDFVTPSSIADEVWEYLRKQLLLGRKYPPGSFIREIEVATSLKISRSPVREALQRLEAHGLVQTIPRRGALVLSYSEQDVTEIYNVRLSLEMLVYQHIVEYGLLTEEHYQELSDCIDRFETVAFLMEQDREAAQLRFFDLDCEFHFAVHRLSGLLWTTELLQKTYSRLYGIQLRHVERDNLDSLVEYHRTLLKNLRSGNIDELRHMTSQSYITGRAFYLQDYKHA